MSARIEEIIINVEMMEDTGRMREVKHVISRDTQVGECQYGGGQLVGRLATNWLGESTVSVRWVRPEIAKHLIESGQATAVVVIK